MPRVLIGFVYRVVRISRNFVWVVLKCPPEVRNKAIGVVDRFGFWLVWSRKQHCARAIEGLAIIRNIPKALPNKRSNRPLAAKVRKGRSQARNIRRRIWFYLFVRYNIRHVS